MAEICDRQLCLKSAVLSSRACAQQICSKSNRVWRAADQNGQRQSYPSAPLFKDVHFLRKKSLFLYRCWCRGQGPSLYLNSNCIWTLICYVCTYWSLSAHFVALPPLQYQQRYRLQGRESQTWTGAWRGLTVVKRGRRIGEGGEIARVSVVIRKIAWLQRGGGREGRRVEESLGQRHEVLSSRRAPTER